MSWRANTGVRPGRITSPGPVLLAMCRHSASISNWLGPTTAYIGCLLDGLDGLRLDFQTLSVFRLLVASFGSGQLFGVALNAASAFGQQRLETLHFVGVSPQDAIALQRRFAAMDPASLTPVAELVAAHLQFAGQFGQPP